MYNKLISRQQRLNCLPEVPVDELRRSGRTTAIILEAIVKAMRTPGTVINVVDHYPGTQPHDLIRLINIRLNQLGLAYFTVTTRTVSYPTIARLVTIRCDVFTSNQWEIK